MAIDDRQPAIDWSLVDLSPKPGLSDVLQQTPGGLWYWTDERGTPSEPTSYAQDLFRRISERSGRERVFAPLREVRAELAKLVEKGGNDAQPGPLCGNEDEYEMIMHPPGGITVVRIWQEANMDVKYDMYAEQETTRVHPPGQPRQEARHQVDMFGSTLSGGGQSVGLPNPRWGRPTCRPDAWAGFAEPETIPAAAILAPVELCLEAGTTHHATNDYVLFGWSDVSGLSRMC